MSIFFPNRLRTPVHYFETHPNFKSMVPPPIVEDANHLAQSIGIRYESDLFIRRPLTTPWEYKQPWYNNGNPMFKLNFSDMDRLYYFQQSVHLYYTYSYMLFRMDFAPVENKKLYVMLSTRFNSFTNRFREFYPSAFISTHAYLCMKIIPWDIKQPAVMRDRVYESLVKEDDIVRDNDNDDDDYYYENGKIPGTLKYLCRKAVYQNSTKPFNLDYYASILPRTLVASLDRFAQKENFFQDSSSIIINNFWSHDDDDDW